MIELNRSPRRAVIVTGAHRSGTTWVGQILAQSPDVAYIFEPFNPQLRPSWLRHRVHGPYLYVTERTVDSTPHLRADLSAMLNLRYPLIRAVAAGPFPKGARFAAAQFKTSVEGRIRRQRPLVKDPLGLFASAWIADTFGADIIVTARHPAAFAQSLLDRSWSFDFRNFTDQPALMEEHLSQFAAETEAAARARLPILEQGALLWKCIYSYVRKTLLARNDVILVRHEDLITDPRDHFERMMSLLSIRWPMRGIHEPASSTFPQRAPESFARWRRTLHADQIATIRNSLNGASDWLYPEATWQ